MINNQLYCVNGDGLRARNITSADCRIRSCLFATPVFWPFSIGKEVQKLNLCKEGPFFSEPEEQEDLSLLMADDLASEECKLYIDSVS